MYLFIIKMHPYYLFYITHILMPYLLYVVLLDPLLPLILAVLWEIFENLFMKPLLGNYSYLFLEVDDSEMESLTDILLFDIYGAIMGIFSGYLLVRYLKINDPVFVLRCEWNTWKNIIILVAMVLVLSPLTSVGWECKEILPWCVNGYHLMPWGMFAIMPIYILYIVYIFDAPNRYYIMIPCILIFITAFIQFYVSIAGAWLAIVLFTILNSIAWTWMFISDRTDYTRLDNV